ncbi:MAG: electron transfer flavoprotein-ubiquinone oxidoreductase [Pseudomonadota bacterium]|nr:electron transfer flavoprotein-ubiquinone oxidoreductase [Pseudomonadota bacterium]
MERESMEVDVLIVGGGPSGLSAAIKLRQLAEEAAEEISVCVLEKGSEVGAHILSGAVLEPRALAELFPDWKERGAPLKTEVVEDSFLFLTEKRAFGLPTPPAMRNDGNYIVSLGNVCRWLKEQAEALDVQIFEGFAGAEILHDEDMNVLGVATGDLGLNREGEAKEGFTAGYELRARYTLFAEGCRGSLTGDLIEKFNMRKGHDPQTYAIGIKELWEVLPDNHKPGSVTHTIGWPLDDKTYGGSFLYHLEDNQVAVGYVIGLDYSNPYLSPFDEFQRFKTHPKIRHVFEGGRRISYGARALNEGGFQSIPDLICPGAAIIGCAAGFVNVPKIKGSHNAMKTGMVAAEAAFDALTAKDGAKPRLIADYPTKLSKSWVWDELYRVRNIRPAFRWGLWIGLLYSALDTYVFRGKAPWTFRNHSDHNTLLPKKNAKKIEYPSPDGTVTFDKLSSVFISNANHEEDQPCHLKLEDPEIPIKVNLKLYDSPEQRYCPAGVYEVVGEGEDARLQINAQNCVHCKTCDIKDPTQNIRWKTPEGGGGPNYPNM